MNAPVNLENCAHLLKRGLNKIYDLRFQWGCSRSVKSRLKRGLIREEFKGQLRVPIFSNLHDFDSIYTAKAGGFKDREDYYRSCSTWDVLDQISAPAVVMTAEDDPFVDYRDYLYRKVPSHVLLHIEEKGGHMGYYSANATPLGTRRWMDYALDSAIQKLGVL